MMNEEMIGGIILAILMWTLILIYGVLLLFSLLSYVISGVSLMKISKKLGVEKGWLAFVPMANYWLMGRLAEEDGKIYHPEQKQKKWGKIYLTVGIVYLVAVLLLTAAFITFSIISTMIAPQGGEMTAAGLILSQNLAQIVFDVLLYAMMIAVMIVGYVVLYKIYHVMAGSSATWMLVLTIVVPLAQLVILLVLAFSKKYPVFALQESAPEEPVVIAQSAEEGAEQVERADIG